MPDSTPSAPPSLGGDLSYFECRGAVRRIVYAAIPVATATFIDSLIPRCSMETTSSHNARRDGGMPARSLPRRRATFEGASYVARSTARASTSRPTIRKPSARSCSIRGATSRRCSHATEDCAPRAVFATLPCSGVGEIPVIQSLATPNESDVRKSEPIFSAERMSFAMRWRSICGRLYDKTIETSRPLPRDPPHLLSPLLRMERRF